MAQQIRKSLRDFLAVTVLVVIAGAVVFYIVQHQRLRIPVLEEKPFELKGEFKTAQAVVPGQGQTIRVAGVRVGDVSGVQIENGRAIVTFQLDRKFLPVYRNATLLMRPATGLKDMFFQLDPGTPAAGEYQEDDVVPLANTAPDVNLDEVLAALDGDSRDYLRILLIGGGQGVKGRAKDLGKLLSSAGPINRDLARLNTAVAQRRSNLANLIHNLNILTRETGRQDANLARLITTSNSTLSAIAEQDPDTRRAVHILPNALQETKNAFAVLDDFGNELGPTFESLRPFARNLDNLNVSTQQLAKTATPVIKNQIRPFVRAARPVLPDLRLASKRFSSAAPHLTVIGKKLNRLTNMAAYNPRGAGQPGQQENGHPRDEGYLYWLAWLSHNSVSVFGSQDGNGLYRRIYFTATCQALAGFANISGIPLALVLNITGLSALFNGPGAPC